MRKHLIHAVVAGLLALCDVSAQQSGGPMKDPAGKTISDREKAGLRGPVRSVIEERSYSAGTDADGRTSPASQGWNKTEYDRDGRISAIWRRAPSPDTRADALTVIRYTYTPAGKLLKRTAEIDGKIASETAYDYDDQERLRSITNSRDPANPIAFRYDATGRKWKIAVRKPVEQPQGTTAVSRSMESLFDDPGSVITTSDGGSTITLYDEFDRPTEVQLQSVSGELTSRAIRTYDQQGHISEEKMLMTDPLSLFSAGQQKRLVEEGATAQELRDKLAEFLGGSEMWSVRYEYDAQGRKTLTVRNTFNHIHETTSTGYNQQGDVASETTHQQVSGTDNPAADIARDTETVYTYEYDTSGNWTAQKTASRDLPDGVLKDLGNELRRTIEYY